VPSLPGAERVLLGWGSWKAVFPEAKMWRSYVNSTVPCRISMAQHYHGTALLWHNILYGLARYIIVIMAHCYYGTKLFTQQIWLLRCLRCAVISGAQFALRCY
jgi:hypothetical protein